MYIIEINGQYVQDISNGMPRFVFGKFGARQFYSEWEALCQYEWVLWLHECSQCVLIKLTFSPSYWCVKVATLLLIMSKGDNP